MFNISKDGLLENQNVKIITKNYNTEISQIITQSTYINNGIDIVLIAIMILMTH